jgi:hypothetical protein
MSYGCRVCSGMKVAADAAAGDWPAYSAQMLLLDQHLRLFPDHDVVRSAATAFIPIQRGLDTPKYSARYEYASAMNKAEARYKTYRAVRLWRARDLLLQEKIPMELLMLSAEPCASFDGHYDAEHVSPPAPRPWEGEDEERQTLNRQPVFGRRLEVGFAMLA